MAERGHQQDAAAVRLVAAGKVREPRKDRPVDLRGIQRVTAPVSSTEIIADVRGDR